MSSQVEEATPNVPIRNAALVFRPYNRGVRFGGSAAHLGKLGGAKLVGFNLEILDPGRQSCPFHWHQREEEHFFILEGRCVLRSGDRRYDMGPGDYVCFPAATGVAHCFENPFAEPCRFIAVGTREPDEIAVYPDSRKILIRALRLIVPYPAQGLDYWDGEAPDQPLARRDAPP